MTKEMKLVVEAVQEVSEENLISEVEAISLMQSNASKVGETRLLELLTQYKYDKFVAPLMG